MSLNTSSRPPGPATAFVLGMRVLASEAWAPGLHDQEAWKRWASLESPPLPMGSDPAPPAAASVPALLRRRAGLSDRLALEVACRLAGQDAQLPSVFASRHGQIARSVDMLEALAADAPLSPMDFSVSVHNATAGLFSIARGDRSSASAVAAGVESFSSALLEAQGLIIEGAERVLAVYHDERPPAVLDGRWDGEPAGWALGLLLGREGGLALDMKLEDLGGEAPRTQEERAWPQALVLARLLGRGWGEERWSKGMRRWSWELRA